MSNDNEKELIIIKIAELIYLVRTQIWEEHIDKLEFLNTMLLVNKKREIDDLNQSLYEIKCLSVGQIQNGIYKKFDAKVDKIIKKRDKKIRKIIKVFDKEINKEKKLIEIEKEKNNKRINELLGD